MKNKRIIIGMCIIILVAIIVLILWNKRPLFDKNNLKIDEKDSNIEIEDNKENKNMKVIINNKEYEIKLEKNETTSSLVNLLPIELNMSELNGNEKYYYLDETLPTNSSIPTRIEKGDIMLYGNNCLVVFYKSFNTSYSYTKIGHINNLPDLGNNSIRIRFEIDN